jgi:uncharacterized short protein YbdD (DUF466 family)
MTGTIGGSLRSMHRLLKEATGEAKWDDYLEACRAAGRTPMSRREFEQHRSRQRECSPQARCC